MDTTSVLTRQTLACGSDGWTAPAVEIAKTAPAFAYDDEALADATPCPTTAAATVVA
ncbi:hypothetical protein [Nocardioides daphniae]|uniref:Uncharacterized protein n=1 Tax=Nocardioides daphniae TaxID=402297 RepID=A0ABQ1PZ36_9ACTN|nr:hypothetical protein [Nocardioides daphniae]GGD07298.1 hypothetical protein GCM10007231_02500 [Nocardioides daphniae]